MGWLSRSQAAALTEEQRLDYLARTILGEAVGEGYTGMLVVAQVIRNRSQDGRWPSDPVAVAGQKHQFTTNSPGIGGNQSMVSRNYGPGTPEYKMAAAAARAAIIEQTVPDITGNAKYYHTTAMGWPSSWPSSIKRNGFIDIGAHRVYPDHPVPPGEIPQRLASIEYLDTGVGTFLSVNERGIQPIRPATMSGTIRLQREVNRVASQKANAVETIKRSRTFAFADTIDPFEGPLRSNVDLVVNRPIPAMRESMQKQLRATGTPMTTERTFAQLVGDGGMDTRDQTLVSVKQPPVVQSTPWGVRERVASRVAATEVEAGRGQMTMTGNPNIPGSVVDWLYPRIAEGQGEANQEGKGPRAQRRPGQSIIEREPSMAQKPSQEPIVVVQPSGAKVVPASQAERSTQNIVNASIKAANEANNPALATSLAASIAAKKATPKPAVTPSSQKAAADLRMMRDASQQASATTAKPAITESTASQAADVALLRQANQNAKPAATSVAGTPSKPVAPKIPFASSSVTVKDEARLPKSTGLSVAPIEVKPTKLPPIAPPKSDPIGTMPRFSDLNSLRRPIEERVAPKPLEAGAGDRARGSNLFGQPEAPDLPAPQLANVALPRPRPAKPETTTSARRPTTVAPQPATVDERITARNRLATTVAAPATSPTLRVVVQRDRPSSPSSPAQTQQSKPAGAMTLVDQFRSQGMSGEDAYDAANQAGRDRAISNAAPQYQDSNALWRQITG